MPQVALPPTLARQVRTARELVEARRRAPEDVRFTTASQGFDRLLEGGLERGAMVELIGRRSSGRFSLVLTTLAAATSAGEAAALVDLGDALDPRTAAEAGVDLERLLWVRPRRLKEVLASAEVILASGMPLVVVDLGMPPVPGGRGVEASWLRLARSARGNRAALLISSPYRVSGTAARAVIEARNGRAAWHSRNDSPWLLRGVAAHLELLKSRKAQRQGDVANLSWKVAADLTPRATPHASRRAATGHRRDATPSPGTLPEAAEVLRFRERAIA